MKKLFKEKILALIGVALAISATCVHAGNWDPYVHSVIIAPAPLLPLEFSGTGVGSLKPGNNGGDELPLGSLLNPNDRMVVTLSLANGVPNVADPSDQAQAVSALGGPGKDYWDWTYTPATATYRGVQNRPIPAYTAQEVTVQYRVTANTFQSASPNTFNGLNVNISPPGYTNPQTTDNDQASSFTYVEAIDFGDAPASYGSASAEINFQKYTSGSYNGQYRYYMFLGSSVDPETTNQPSATANSDDIIGSDDENGVTFPVLTVGNEATLSITATVVQRGSTGYLNAWIDWNGDGDFDDVGEYVIESVSSPAGAGVKNLSQTVQVPADAITTRPTFARFRFGEDWTESFGTAAYGEVEDYQITIQAPPQPATLGDRVWNDLDGDGVQESFEPGISGVRVYVDSNASGTYNAGEPTATTAADGSYHIADLVVGTYTARVDTATLPVGLTQTYDMNGALDHAAVVTLTSGQTRTDVDFGYRSTQTHAIRGQVRDDYNRDGSFGDPDLPVGGVLISLYSDPNGDGTNTDGVVLGTVRTTADGRYAFTNLLSGAYVVVEHDPIGAVSTADAFAHNDNMIAVIIVAADSVDNDFLDAVDPSGYFYDVADGRIVPGGQIAVSGEGADILMDGSNGQYMFVSTNQVETSFTIAVTPPSGYMIDPTRPAQPGTFDATGGPDPTVLGSFENPAQPGYLINHSSASNTYYYVFSLAPGDPLIINNNFPLVKSVTIGSHVWEDLNGNGVQDSGEPGVSNVVVRLLDSSSTLMAVTSTDENGAYLFTNQPPASCQVEFVPPAAYRFTVQHAAGANALTDSDAAPSTGLTPLTVMAGGETNLTVDAGVYIPANLYGYLFEDEDGNLLRNSGDTSITNALVTLTVNGSTVATALTDQWGYYSFADIPVGVATILVSQVNATLLAVPATNDERRNRAVFSTVESAMIVYPVVSGYGVLASLPGEQLNFGFDQYPLSTALSLKAYASDGKVMIEIATVNENGQSAIEIYAQINGEWVAVAQVPAERIVGFGDNAYTVEAFGLTPGESYRFRIVDEAGHIFESDLIEVALASVLIDAVTLAPEMIKVAFNTEYGNFYQVMVCGRLGAPWVVEYVQYPTARGWSALSNESFMAGPGERTEVLIPRNNRPQAFFKIIQVQ